MIRICALNTSTSADDDGNQEKSVVATKEAQEAEAFAIYNKALSLQIQGDVEKAEETFKELLQHGFVQEAAKLIEEEVENHPHPGLQILYSTHKNMASIASQRKDLNSALESNLKAVMVDATEVTVWYKIGTISLEIHNYQLAGYAFKQGLKCSPNHWPCLDNVITVLYALNDYWTCMKFIARALEKDYDYAKGICFRDQMFSEQPSLKRDSSDLFKNCDPFVFCKKVDQKEAAEYVNEALEMRRIRRELAGTPEPEPLKLPQPITSYSWKCVGECLIALYKEIAKSDPPVSMGLKVDLSPYVNISTTGSSQIPFDSITTATQPFSVTPEFTTESQARVSTPEVLLSELPVTSSENLATSSITTTATTTTSTSMSSSLSSQAIISHLSSPPAATIIQDHPCTVEVDEAGNRKAPKRKRMPVEEVPCKRRSARVRNTTKRKQEENVNLQELLLKFLPSSLMQVREEEDEARNHGTEQSNALHVLGTPVGTNRRQSDMMLLNSTEDVDVQQFLKDCQKNSGIIDLMNTYLVCLADWMNFKWPPGLAEIYLHMYGLVRKHLVMPSYLCQDVPNQRILDMAKMVLVWEELKLDQWLVKKAKSAGSPGNSPRCRSPSTILPNQLEPHFPGLFYLEDLWFISGLIGYIEIVAEFWAEHSIRVSWLQARFNMLQGQMDEAVGFFEKTIDYLRYAQQTESLSVVKLLNCKMDNIISVEQIRKQQESLRRCQSLEETQKMYETGEYDKVVEMLLPTFSESQQKGGNLVEIGTAIPERHAQLLLLQDSLLKLNNYAKCLYWGEISFSEALYHYRKANTHSSKEEWVSTMTQIFQGLDTCLKQDSAIIGFLPSANLVRLTQDLIRVIRISLEVPETTIEMPIGSVVPWILLYRLIKHEEDKFKELQEVEPSTGNLEGSLVSMEKTMSSSLMLLNVAHEYLGRHSWCTKSQGALLLFFLDTLIEQINQLPVQKSSLLKNEFDQAFEQCIYCLYGHPNKKAKARHLQDHNAPQIILKWERARDLFEYYKPKTVPEFDSYKTSTVSGELENLLRRIFILIPRHVEAAIPVETVTAYIEGLSNDPPATLPDKIVTLPVVKEIYYLLADYYFKNKEQVKAIKFYIFDICVHPERLDSWAGMALARMSRLEQKLNSMELKMDMPVHKQSISALRCFARAVEIDSGNGKLWIEYGSLAYQLHSHASRQLMMLHWFPLNDEILQIATTSHRVMLLVAQNCYKKASECVADGHGEEWLHHYMMGKVAEKLRRPAKEYLEHYRQAALHLHEEYASYPKRIHYVVSPPHLAVESLEMFYRQHVSILKELLRKDPSEIDFDFFEEYITEVANGPFAKHREKRRQRKESKDVSSSSIDENSLSVLSSILMGSKLNPTFHRIPQDHNYSRQKSTEGMDKPADGGTDAGKDALVGTFLSPHNLPTKVCAPLGGSTVVDMSQGSSVNKMSDSRIDVLHFVGMEDPKKSAMFSMENILGDSLMYSRRMNQEPSTSSGESSVSTVGGLGIASDRQKKPLDLSFQDQPEDLSMKRVDPSKSEFTASTLHKNKSILAKMIGEQQQLSTKENEIVKSGQQTDLLSTAVSRTEKLDSAEGQSNGQSFLSSVGKHCSPLAGTTQLDLEGTDKQSESDDGSVKHFSTSSSTATAQDSESVSSMSDSSNKHEVSSGEEKRPRELRHKQLINMCIEALQACLARFPTHYKSLYRLSYVYFHSPFHKNPAYARDLLLGNPAWSQLPHMPAPGLFADRKQTNFFQGVWRIPIEEIDRSGSFASHMNRSIKLLLEVLKVQKDSQILYHMHLHFIRTPDTGRKYLRDAERVYFSQLAYEFTLDALEAQVALMAEEDDFEKCIKFLMEVYKIWYYGVNKMWMHVERINELFVSMFRVVKKEEFDDNTTLVQQMEQAIRFCQQHLSTVKNIQGSEYQRQNSTSSSSQSATSYSLATEKPVEPVDVPHYSRKEMDPSYISKQPSINNEDKLSISAPEKLTSDVQAKLSSVEPMDLSIANPSVVFSRSPLSIVDPRKLIKPCTVKLDTIPHNLMSMSTHRLAQSRLMAVAVDSANSLLSTHHVQSSSEPNSPTVITTPDILSATHSQ